MFNGDNIINDDLEILSQILNPVKEKTLKLEEGENRVVSILFLDVKGFTSMSEKLSSEDVKLTMDRILTAFTNSIIKFGGYIDKYEGDLIMALFGSKVTSETDTERAIDAGLKILSDLNHINKILNVDLSIRIGINTGLVTTGKVGMKREGDFTVYGDAVNVASRMEANAPLNSILIPEETKNIVNDIFIFKDMGQIEVKGKEKPISIFKVISKQKKKTERWERNRELIKNSLYVGRKKELVKMQELYKKSANELGTVDSLYHPLVIGIKGYAGIGKSRIVKEFLRSIDIEQSSILSGYTRSYAQPAYHLWTSLLKSYFSIEDNDNKEKIIKALDKHYAELADVTKNEEDIMKAKNVIGYMFGVKYDDPRLENVDPSSLQTLINISIRYTIEAIAIKVNSLTKQPLLIYLDDMQWIDDPSGNLLNNIIISLNSEEKRDARPNKNIFILMTYRTNYDPTSDISDKSNFFELELNPLTVYESKELINSMIGVNKFSEQFFEKMMRNSLGNPFYIEELIHFLIENEKITLQDYVWVFSDNSDEIHLPSTINNIILSRIDKLEDAQKTVLQRASVIGNYFFKPLLSLVIEQLDDEKLDEQVFRSLLVENWIRKDIDEEKYLFKHILASEICYKTILNYNKKILHKVIAEVSVQIFKDNDEFNSFIANHYIKSDPEDGSSEYEKMILYLEKAGKYAKLNYENENAVNLFNDLLTYNISDVKRVEAGLNIVEILELTGEWDKAKSLVKKCLESSLQLNNRYFIAESYRLSGIISWKLGDAKIAMNFHKKALDIYSEINDEKGVAESYGNIGNMYYCEGEYDKATEVYNKKLNICRKIKDKSGEANTLGNIGVMYWAVENYELAMKYLKQDLDICKEIGDKAGYSRAIGNMGLVYNETRDSENAMICYEEKLNICEDIGDRQGIAHILGNMGIVYEELGKLDEAKEYYEKHYSLCKELKDKEGVSIAHGNIGNILFETGKYNEAIQHYDLSIQIGRELNIKYYLCSYLYYKSQVLFMMDDPSAKEINDEALKLSIEVDRLVSIIKSRILKEKINFKFSNDINEKKESINNLIKFANEQEYDEIIAELNYEIALLQKQIDDDYEIYREKAHNIFTELYKNNGLYGYKKIIDELNSL